MYSTGLAFSAFIGGALAVTTDPSLWTTATLGDKTFVNQGLVGFGYIPASARDSYGETLGGLGSAIALQKGTFKAGPNGTFTGRLISQPDRGYNVETTIDWQARHHSFDFVLSPYYDKINLDFDTAAKTFSIQYKSSLLYSKAPGFPTSGLDAISSIPNTTVYPVLPAPGLTKLSVDAEGLVLNADGRFARLFRADPSLTTAFGPQTREWVVPLPQSKKGKTYAQSEIYALSSTQFLVLSRDGHGHGDDGNEAKSDYKQADLFDISNATDIHGTKFDGTTAVAPKGKLDKTVIPAIYVPFVNYLNSTQLARFGLHNDEPTDRTLIDAKWESFALAPVLDTAAPDDYFLITMADNDFITINGIALGKPYSASYGQDVDTQILVWRVTLPSVPRGSIAASLGI
ncbi:hypothetical protein FRC11_014704 [Ceratobasidium sp. 423]|nr:hypothetical protein FRC11_014704 [Ceratobasidium sp. 423]